MNWKKVKNKMNENLSFKGRWKGLFLLSKLFIKIDGNIYKF